MPDRNQGRVHTSAATVTVLPEAEDLDIKIDDKDLRIDVFRSIGPGGRCKYGKLSCKITHIPEYVDVNKMKNRK